MCQRNMFRQLMQDDTLLTVKDGKLAMPPKQTIRICATIINILQYTNITLARVC
jgi:hypothetical protein